MRILAIIASMSPTVSLACGELIQSCTFNDGAKTVTVCLEPNDVTYAFGQTGGVPELALDVPIVDVDYVPWPGVGNSIWESIRFYNGEATYVVTAGFQKLQEDQDEPDPPFGAVEVYINNELAADLVCDAGSVEWAGFGTDGIYGAKTEAGQCYDHGEGEWITCE